MRNTSSGEHGGYQPVFTFVLTLPRTHRVHSHRGVAAHPPTPPSVAPAGRHGPFRPSRTPGGRIPFRRTGVLVDVYHELARPQEVLRKLRAPLKPDGRLVLVEFRKESAWVPIREEHKMSVKEARMELEAEGYRFDRVIAVLPWQHILVFRR